jgi:hypothetical protein
VEHLTPEAYEAAQKLEPPLIMKPHLLHHALLRRGHEHKTSDKVNIVLEKHHGDVLQRLPTSSKTAVILFVDPFLPFHNWLTANQELDQLVRKNVKHFIIDNH